MTKVVETNDVSLPLLYFLEIAAFGNECKLCKLGVGVIYDTVGDPALETRIEQLTKELCIEYVGDDEEVSWCIRNRENAVFGCGINMPSFEM